MIFSVVIPTHKRKRLLKNLLDSLESQNIGRDNFEVIVVATENDTSLDLLTEYPWKMNLQISEITNDPFNGKSAAAKRNFGAQRAQAPWIAFIDDDCIASPQWLSAAKKDIDKHSPQMVEGGVHIPEPEKKTLTYKGLKRLSKAGGFQTCNMFYKKNDFMDVGGFDNNFPYYLEDTDLAWTMLEHGKKSIHCQEAQVSHPVPPAQPKKLLDNALRMEKLIYLSKKHPQTFKNSSIKAFSKAYKIFILIDLIFILSLFTHAQHSQYIFLLRLVLTFLYLVRMFRNCTFTPSEVSQVYYYSLICPLISLFQYFKGHFKH